jgi:UDP-N-acetylglucosamine 2-epimerase (non-hydrolysing)
MWGRGRVLQDGAPRRSHKVNSNDRRPLVLVVAGARPNFVKVAPIITALRGEERRLQFRFVHTGQHHDRSMSGVFLEELKLPTPDFNLGVTGGSHASVTARTMLAFDVVCDEIAPDHVLVVLAR